MITRDTILAILDVHLSSHKAINGKGEVADRILAALEKEREGESVLWTGEMGGIGLYVPPIPGVEGNHGQIIFRPTKAEKGGE